jgi:hypothetical protein
VNKGSPATGEQPEDKYDMMAPPIRGSPSATGDVKNAACLFKNQTKEGLSILVLMFEKEGGVDGRRQSHAGLCWAGSHDAAALKEALSSPEVQLPK